MTENEKIAALAAALDGMKAERNWYRAAWSEAFRERDELRGRLDSLKQSEDATSRALANMHAQCESRDNLIARYRRELATALDERDRAETEMEHAKNSLAVVREQRDELRNWYQAAMEHAEEFGVGG